MCGHSSTGYEHQSSKLKVVSSSLTVRTNFVYYKSSKKGVLVKLDRNHWYDEDVEDQDNVNCRGFQKVAKKAKVEKKHKDNEIQQRRRQRAKERKEQMDSYMKEYEQD